MNDFFDKNLLQNFVVGLVIMFVGFLFVDKTSSKTGSSKFWKAVVVLSVLAMLGGFYLFMTYFPKNGFNSASASAGLALLIFGYIFHKLGKFFNWWNN